MKKPIALILALIFIFPATSVFGASGDLGFFGGISEGTRLPKTTEQLLTQQANRNAPTVSMPYKEMVFLDGIPVEYNGLIEIRSGTPNDTQDVGTYAVSYATRNSAATDPAVANVARSINFNVNYRKDGSQTIKDFSVRSWTERITLESATYNLDPSLSYFNVSILEDKTPGVTYYSGSVSQRSVYTTGDDVAGNITVDVVGSIYGYDSAWSNAETHRLDCIVQTNDWQMQYQLRPSVAVNKVLQYSENEPSIISFPGNYMEVIQNKSGMQYDIFVKPQRFYDVPATGSIAIQTPHTFEQLIAPDVSFLTGSPSQEDIKKLFSMRILEGNTKYFVPNQSITRGQYVTALVKAIKLPIAPVTTARNRKATVIVFPDVTEERAEYPQIMAAYNSGLVVGRQNGHFYVDSTITREEEITILIRALGLQNLAPNPTPVTSFVDDNKISSWAKREIYVAQQIGLISADENGCINPNVTVSKAEAAALINRLVDFMRNDIQFHYTDYIVNFAS